MRQGEVLETVPGVIITQHSGEGKANQYFLRGFNLDHGSDFAMTVAGAPVNMVTHAHSQGYSDLNFLIPELVAGVQYLEGPVLRRAGRFRDGRIGEHQLRDPARSTDRAPGGGRLRLRARRCSPRRRSVGDGHLLVAFETSTNDGPWTVPDEYQEAQWRRALQPRRQRQRPVADRDGLSWRVERHAGGRRGVRWTPG